MKKSIIIKRAIYGKDSTPVELREYNIIGFSTSAVGTISDWKKFAKLNNSNHLIIIEKDGTKHEMSI